MGNIIWNGQIIGRSAGVEVTSIVKIDDKLIADGKTGPITRKLQALYKEEIERQCGTL